jgi:hypothetical protein
VIDDPPSLKSGVAVRANPICTGGGRTHQLSPSSTAVE